MRWRGSTIPTTKCSSIDNNTQDEAVWRPVEAALPRARRALPLLPRRSAGGLQGRRAQLRARADRAPDAAIVAVIDSDYKVEPHWLRDLVPALRRPEASRSCRRRRTIATSDESAFKAMCYAEYRGFFHIGMITRNERNAIIQHGTMTLVRRAALEAGRRLGGVVHHRRCGARPASVRARLRSALPAAQLRPRPDAGNVHRLQEAALPLGLRRDADPASACARAVLAHGRAPHARASAITSSPAGCRGSPTASTCCSTSPRSAGRSR